MKIVTQQVTLDELERMAAGMFGNMVKAVVDVDRELLAVDGELHSDLEALLIENGSKQQSLWGINLYPEMTGRRFRRIRFHDQYAPVSGEQKPRRRERAIARDDYRDSCKEDQAMNYQHAGLAAGRWKELPFLERMANIGGEVERALGWRDEEQYRIQPESV